jgi:hypothetical protein
VTAAPRPVVEAYWQGYVDSARFGGGGVDLDQVASVMPVDVVKIAFYNLFPANGVTTCFGFGKSHGWGYTAAGIEALHQAGIRVLASLIGTPDPPVGWNDIADPAAFAGNVKALLVDELGCDGIDIDNEDPAAPDDVFMEVVTELRKALGPKGSGKALLTAVTYVPGRDLPWLKAVGGALDWVSTMAYWLDPDGQRSLFQQYAAVLGPANVLVGVGCPGATPPGQETSPQTVAAIAGWESTVGPGAAGGMMLWALSSGAPSLDYYGLIRDNLTTWNPPAAT